MKISEFSKKYDVSNDTVRYYMKLNLIIPEKKGGHYNFNKECEREMQAILKFKEMGFTLPEIQFILKFKRFGKLTSYEQNTDYQNLFKDKIEDLKEKIAELNRARDELEAEIADLEIDNDARAITIGIDLAALGLFACPRCQQDLLLTADRVEVNQVVEGSLKCSCGEILKIKEGIIYSADLARDDHDREEVQPDDFHIENYIKSTSSEYIAKSYHSIEWLQRQLKFEELIGKVIMEPGSGYGHFLRQVYDKLPEEVVYLCIDNSPHKNRYLKHLLEQTGKRKKVIFITADLKELPLKDDIIDLVIDFTGTSTFSFQNKEFLPGLLDSYVKEQAELLAAFIIYHKFGTNNIVALPFRNNFVFENIRGNLLELNYMLAEEFKSKIVKVKESPGKYERYAQPGDEIYAYQIRAERKME